MKDTQRDWAGKMPSLNFPASWTITIIPPFGGALIRFLARKNGRWVSVYFDVEDNLGSMGQPYWEIYPAADSDTARFLLGEEADMLIAIHQSLNREKPQ